MSLTNYLNNIQDLELHEIAYCQFNNCTRLAKVGGYCLKHSSSTTHTPPRMRTMSQLFETTPVVTSRRASNLEMGRIVQQHIQRPLLQQDASGLYLNSASSKRHLVEKQQPGRMNNQHEIPQLQTTQLQTTQLQTTQLQTTQLQTTQLQRTQLQTTQLQRTQLQTAQPSTTQPDTKQHASRPGHPGNNATQFCNTQVMKSPMRGGSTQLVHSPMPHSTSQCSDSPIQRSTIQCRNSPSQRGLIFPESTLYRNSFGQVGASQHAGSSKQPRNTCTPSTSKSLKNEALAVEMENHSQKVGNEPKGCCQVKGCTRKVHGSNGVLCEMHVRKRKCQYKNCLKYALLGGFCTRHGGGKRCKIEGCNTVAQAGGKCKLHGGGSKCNLEGCDAIARSSGRCIQHGGRYLCTVEGCHKTAHRRKRCVGHGGGVNPKPNIQY